MIRRKPIKPGASLVDRRAERGPAADPALYCGTRSLPPFSTISVPTRHGRVRCLLQQPHPDAPLSRGTGPAPMVVYLHSGGFVQNNPRSEEHLTSYLASDVGTWVLSVDYATAPQARYPVAEQQSFDVTTWVASAAAGHPWDVTRVAVGGASAGGKLAINVCQQAHQSGGPAIAAAILVVPVVDISRTDRTSSLPTAMISPEMQQLMADSYFVDHHRRTEPLASPRFDTDLAAAMPPTLIQTAELDTLGPEGCELASVLTRGGTEVQHRQFDGVDHAFGSTNPTLAAELINDIGDFLLKTIGPTNPTSSSKKDGFPASHPQAQ